MNWKRIGTGTIAAAGVWAAFNMAALLYLQKTGAVQPAGSWSRALGLQVLPAVLTGFLLCWLYVLARPRLGPGPKTALLMGTVAFALANEQILNIGAWLESPAMVGEQIVFGWLKCVGAIYVAGWQYIEKAP